MAHGAVSFYLDRYIASRVARHTYGTKINTLYDETRLSHRQRAQRVYTCHVSGNRRLRDGFCALMKKVLWRFLCREFRPINGLASRETASRPMPLTGQRNFSGLRKSLKPSRFRRRSQGTLDLSRMLNFMIWTMVCVHFPLFDVNICSLVLPKRPLLSKSARSLPRYQLPPW